MTPRSYLYFKIKHALKAVATEEGRRYLAMKGLFPIPTTLEGETSGRIGAGPSIYFIDKKGNIVGTTIPQKESKVMRAPIWDGEQPLEFMCVEQPESEPHPPVYERSTYEVRFSFTPEFIP